MIKFEKVSEQNTDELKSIILK